MQGFQRYLGVSLLVSHISCAVACAAVGVTGVESPGTVRINVKGATVTLNRKSLAGFVYVTDGHINLNGDVSQTLVVTNGSVQIGENVTVGAAFLSGGRVDALRGVAITNMAYINGTTFMLRGGPCFSMSGSHLSDPEHGSKRNISVSAGTLSLSVGHGVVIGTSGSGTSAFDSETGLWSLTETGVGGFDGDGAYMRYITIPPMDFDFTLRAVSNPQVWNKACVMVRDGLVQSGASGVHRANLYFGNIAKNWATRFQGNPSGASSGAEFDDQNNQSVTPHWMRITRVGDVVSAFRSSTGIGTNWNQCGFSHRFPSWGRFSYVGIAVDSSANGVVDTYDNVSFLASDRMPESLNTDLYINTGATLDLDYVGTFTLFGLYIDGKLQGAGAWGASGTGASFIDNAHFSGMGTLTSTQERGLLLILR